MTDNYNIDNLLDRFFEGETTCAEEKALQEFFAGDNVPEHLKAYIPMFKWYADGMQGEPGSELKQEPIKRKPRFLKPLIWISSVAAAVAIILAAGWNYHTDRVQKELLAKQHEGSYMMIDGVMLTDMDDISDEIKALNLEAERIELELQAAELEINVEKDGFIL